MAVKKNQLRNSSKDDKPKNEAKNKKKDTKPKKLKNPLAGKFTGLTKFVGDERLHKVFGLSMLLLSAYLLIAFISFLVTSETDMNFLEGPNVSYWQLLMDNDVEVDNWLGKLGAILSHKFIHHWFGIASFAFVLVFFLIGFRVLFKVSLLPLKKTLKYSFFGLLWTSLLLGYLFDAGHFYMGGAFGYQVNLWLGAVFGGIGTGLLIAAAAFTFVIVAFNPAFDQIKRLLTKSLDEGELEEASSEGSSAADIDGRNTVREDGTAEEAAPADLTEDIEEETTADAEIEATPEEESQIELGSELEMEINTTEEVPLDETPEPRPEPVAEDNSTELELDTELPEGTTVLEGEHGELGIEVTVAAEEEVVSEDDLSDMVKEFGEYDPKLDLASYQLPPIDLLEAYGDKNISIDKGELEQNKNRIIETLRNYKIEISKISATIGPTVTLYEIVPAPGVRISKIKNLEDDIALSLAALGIRIIAPIPGRGTIGIEVPNSKPEIVAMRTLIAADKFQNSEMALPCALGKTIANETFVYDLAAMPHLLMAGATGQGKSVGLNAILVSLLYLKHPSQVKFVLVDPKKVELTLFNKIERHFLAQLPDAEEAIITDTSKVVATVNSLCVEMDNRYELLKNAQVRNIKEYNAKFVARRLNPENGGHRYLPYIVLVVDEFADLIMTAGKEIETPIARLAQLARAIGIHLIIATQRPSVNIITGTIKANFPARIAFRVTSKIDSRTILDAGGAEQLIGRGDMLMSTGNDLIRLQCGFVDTPEVDAICAMIGAQRGYPTAFLLPEYIDPNGEGGAGPVESHDRDVLYEDAARIVVLHQQGSASLLQRKLKLGYNRAGRIVDQLEAAGIVGPFEGSKARKVLIPDEYSLEQMLNADAKKSES
jgi:S-DNA-T family DNA segregation ATPase FtsK/SpoIIIE